tara:strand:- start:206 stop:511 length:306 start_codon:yes stop_codon:yes gene_type:complete
MGNKLRMFLGANAHFIQISVLENGARVKINSSGELTAIDVRKCVERASFKDKEIIINCKNKPIDALRLQSMTYLCTKGINTARKLINIFPSMVSHEILLPI